MKNLNKEKLLFDLPDFIEGKIDEENKLAQINFLINSDNEFRAEYEDLKNAITFTRNTEYSEPHDFYFNTLLTNIRDRIEQEKSVKQTSIFEIFKPSFLKFALPLLIAAIILTTAYSLGVFDNKITEAEFVETSESIIPDIAKENQIKEEIEQTNIEEKEFVNEIPVQNTVVSTRTGTTNNNITQSALLSNGNSIQEYLDEVDNPSGLNYESIYDNEFSDLTSEEEDQIIESLTKIQL